MFPTSNSGCQDFVGTGYNHLISKTRISVTAKTELKLQRYNDRMIEKNTKLKSEAVERVQA